MNEPIYSYFALHDGEGRLTHVVYCPSGDAQLHAGRIHIADRSDVDADLHYAQDGAILDRPETTLALPNMLVVGQTFTLQAPDGFHVWIDGEHVGIHTTEDPLVFAADEPGHYHFKLELFPYKAVQRSVTVA